MDLFGIFMSLLISAVAIFFTLASFVVVIWFARFDT